MFKVGDTVLVYKRTGEWTVTATRASLDGFHVTQNGSGCWVRYADLAHAAPLPDATAKPTNPKDVIGSGKLPLHLWPETASAMGCVALANGALKYGRANWRHAGVRASIYADACRRHLAAWFEGEEADTDDGVPHLAAALACLAIIVDARAAGKLMDDRQTPGGYRALMDELTPHIARLKAHHADKTPRHFTVEDKPE